MFINSLSTVFSSVKYDTLGWLNKQRLYNIYKCTCANVTLWVIIVKIDTREAEIKASWLSWNPLYITIQIIYLFSRSNIQYIAPPPHLRFLTAMSVEKCIVTPSFNESRIIRNVSWWNFTIHNYRYVGGGLVRSTIPSL